MAIEYRITTDDEHDFSYRIELDRDYDRRPPPGAEMDRLDHQRCSTARSARTISAIVPPPWTCIG